MRFSTLLSLSLAAGTVTLAAPFNYGTDKVRGVSLGGWLLLESFITPSIFTATNDVNVKDEYTYGQKYGSAVASQRLKQHWDTFVTEQSFAQIKSYGLNHVRIPIGYWGVPGMMNSSEPFATGQYPYLLKAVGWAQKYNLRVIIDLHGAPGSQNGFDNSGRMGPIRWHQSQYDVDKTLRTLKYMINDFVTKPQYRDTVTAIQPVNEPGGFLGGAEGARLLEVTKQYYYDSYGSIRWPFGNSTQSSALVFLHDAFQDQAYWTDFMRPPNWQNVALDRHYYSIFSQEQARWNNTYRLQQTCQVKSELAASNQHHWSMLGEWCLADTDCAGSKNLVPNAGGSFYDGTQPNSQRVGSCVGKSGTAADFSSSQKEFMRRYFEAQVAAAEAASGWVFWTWKTERAWEWSYSHGVESGWIPRNPTERIYPDPCIYPPVLTTSTTSSITTTRSTSTTRTSSTTISSASITSTASTTSRPASSTTAPSTAVSPTTKPTTASSTTTLPTVAPTTSRPVAAKVSLALTRSR